ncbi:MAG: hypothetical protein ABI634_20350 [Acidobacteriota bacterium]
MMRTNYWLAGLAVMGTVSGVLAAGLTWMVLVHPLALVQAFSGVR